MTRIDRLALTAGAIAGVSAYALWRHRETARAFVEVADPRGTSPVDVERSIGNIQKTRPLYTPDYDWLITPNGGALHHATLTRQQAEACEDEGGIYDEPVRLDCGRVVTTVLIPGLFARGGIGEGVPRCFRCCKVTGLPTGYGSPKNSDECRRLLGMEAS